MASRLWRTMQIIEANRHRAEQLEAAASTAHPAVAPVLTGIAVQHRAFADRIYALFRGERTAPEGEGGCARCDAA